MTRWLAFALLAMALSACKEDGTRSYPGWVEADDLRLSSEVGGMIESIHVREGEDVAQGAPLVTIDDAPFVHQIKAISAEIEASKARRLALLHRLALAKKEYLRLQKLWQRKAVAQEALDAARTRWRALQAETRAASATIAALQARLAEAKRKRAQCRLRAPEAGRVVDVLVRESERIGPLAPMLRLRPKGAVKLIVFVPEQQMGRLAVGVPMKVRVNAIGPFAAKVVRIADQLEFTPPVLFAEEQRARLVRRIELAVPDDIAARLPVGAPVDAWLADGAR